MDLTELQSELRSIERQLAKLQTEVEEMKPRPQEEIQKKYNAIDRLGAQYPLKRVKLGSAPENIKRMVIRGLSFLVQAEDQGWYSRILYLCRLSDGIGFQFSAADICRMGLDIDEEDLKAMCCDLADHKYVFLTEAFIITNLTGECSAALLGLTAGIAEMIKCDKEEVWIISRVARSVLLGKPNELSEMPMPSHNRWMGVFRDYIPGRWIEEQRVRCAELCTGSPGISLQISAIANKNGICDISYRIDAGTLVKKGQRICNYKECLWNGMSTNTVERSIDAPCDGVVFFVNERRKISGTGRGNIYLLVYVVSWLDDYDDFCAWVQNKQIKYSEGGEV